MLLLAALAHSAPLSPAAAQSVKVGAEIAALVTTQREWIAVKGCSNANCNAVRAEVLQGGQLDVRVARNWGLYVQAARLVEHTDAAAYEGLGYAVTAGVKGGADLEGNLGVDGWVSYGRRSSADPTPTDGLATLDSSIRNQIDLGGDLRFGHASDGFLGWVGAEGTYNSEALTVLDGSTRLDVRSAIPVSLVAGVLVLSEPLSGPWAQRGKIGAGVSGSAGFRTGVSAWLVVAL